MMFTVLHKGSDGYPLLGRAQVTPSQLLEGATTSMWLPLESGKSSPEENENRGFLHVYYLLGLKSLDTFLFSIRQNSWKQGYFTIKNDLGKKSFSFEGLSIGNFSLQDMFKQRSLITVKYDETLKAPSYDFYDYGAEGLLMTLTQVINSKKTTRFRAETKGYVLKLRGEYDKNLKRLFFQFITTRSHLVVAQISNMNSNGEGMTINLLLLTLTIRVSVKRFPLD